MRTIFAPYIQPDHESRFQAEKLHASENTKPVNNYISCN